MRSHLCKTLSQNRNEVRSTANSRRVKTRCENQATIRGNGYNVDANMMNRCGTCLEPTSCPRHVYSGRKLYRKVSVDSEMSKAA